MPIRVDAYMAGGVASGVLARVGTLREVLEVDGVLALERVYWQPLHGQAGPRGKHDDPDRRRADRRRR